MVKRKALDGKIGKENDRGRLGLKLVDDLENGWPKENDNTKVDKSDRRQNKVEN